MSESDNRMKPRLDVSGEGVARELGKIENELMLDQYHPQYLAHGGEHIIFSIPGHPNSVIKVQRNLLARLIYEKLKAGLPIDSEPEDFEQQKDEFLKKERQVNRDLKKYFGKAVLGERPYHLKVPVTKALMNETEFQPIAKRMPEGTVQVSALVRIQEKAPQEATDENAKGPNVNYLEGDVLDSTGMKNYEDLNSVLLDNRGELPEEIPMNMGKRTHELIDLTKEDQELRQVVKDFVERVITYTEDTGEVIDIGGKDNVSFFKKDGKWQYLLIDAKYPERQVFLAGQEVLKKFEKGDPLDFGEKTTLLLTVSYVRIINVIAKAVGSNRFLNITDHPIAGKSRDFYLAMHDIAKS